MSIQHRRLQAQVDEKNARIAELEAALEEAEANYTAACIKLASATGRDLPELDATDAAHPAWWRGNDYGVVQICRALTEVLEGKEPAGKSAEPYESLRQRVWEVCKDRERLDWLMNSGLMVISTSPAGDWRARNKDYWFVTGCYDSQRAAIDAARGTK